jgi:hypothetical protein
MTRSDAGIAEMRETWAEVHWDVERIFEGDGVVVSFYRSISVGRKSGAWRDARYRASKSAGRRETTTEATCQAVGPWGYCAGAQTRVAA